MKMAGIRAASAVWWKPLALLAGLTLIGAVASIAWYSRLSDHEASEGAGKWVELSEKASEHRVVVKGVVMPIRVVDVVSPIDGVVAGIDAAWGDLVQKGSSLIRIQSQELDISLREAEAAYLRGRSEMRGLRDKKNSPDYSGVVRRHLSARQSLVLAESRRQEAAELYRKGIIARQELEQAELEVRTSEEQLQGAIDELRVAELKWGAEVMKVAEIEQDIRKRRYEELVEKQKKMLIHAPIAGIVLQPNADGDKGGGGVREIRVGSGVTSREVLMTIADTSSYLVYASVRQEDLQWVRPGGRAVVVLDQDGQNRVPAIVHRISSQPRQFNPSNVSSMLQSNQGSEFEVQFLVNSSSASAVAVAEQTPGLRLGAQVSIEVSVEDRTPVLAIPTRAISWDASGAPAVKYRLEDGKTEIAKIKVVRVSRDEVVVDGFPFPNASVWVHDFDAGEGASGME